MGVDPSRHLGRAQSVLAASAVLGGALWAALAVVAWLETAGTISYDAFNRLLVFPLLAMAVGLVAVYRAIAPRSALARSGFATLLLAFALLITGNVAEFWGALAFDEVNAQAAHEAGVSKHWIGSDIGWMIFGAGMLAAVVGAGVFAFALRGVALPATLRLFVGLIGIGILAANLFGLGPLLVSAAVFVLYGTGWIALGLRAFPAS